MKNKALEIPVLIMALVAIFVAFGSSVSVDQQNHSKDVSAAIASYQLNDSSSTTVYQQQVTNGWAAKDLLNVIGQQNATIIDNQVASVSIQSKTNFLLGVNVVMLALVTMAVSRMGKDKVENSTASEDKSNDSNI